MYPQIILILILISLWGCGEKSIKDIEFRSVSNNKKITLKKLDYDYAVLYVWSGTCVGHEKDLLKLNSLQEKLGSDIKIISLAILMERDAVVSTLKDLGIEPEFVNLYDTKARITEAVNIITLPSTLIIDKRGKVIKELALLPSAKSIKNIIKNYKLSSKSSSSP